MNNIDFAQNIDTKCLKAHIRDNLVVNMSCLQFSHRSVFPYNNGFYFVIYTNFHGITTLFLRILNYNM